MFYLAFIYVLMVQPFGVKSDECSRSLSRRVRDVVHGVYKILKVITPMFSFAPVRIYLGLLISKISTYLKTVSWILSMICTSGRNDISFALQMVITSANIAGRNSKMKCILTGASYVHVPPSKSN